MGAMKERALELMDEMTALHVTPHAYVEHYLDTCPCCGSAGACFDGEELCGLGYRVYGWCDSCGARWHDHFAWVERVVDAESEEQA